MEKKMCDIIWGNGASVLSNNSFVLSVTHQKNGNEQHYSETEKIKITSADLPGLPQSILEWSEELLKTCVINAFLKCEIEERDESGMLVGRVSHSGVGGY